MSELEPWIEGGVSADILETLHAARRERPRDELIERCAVLVSAGGLGITAAAAVEGAPLAGGSGALGTTSALTLGLLKWGAGGVLAGALLVTSVHVTQRSSPASGPIAPALSTPQKVEALPVRDTVPRITISELALEPAPSANPATMHELPFVKTPPLASASGASADERFAEELALIDRVRASIDAHAPALATALLAEHEQRFGKAAQLAPEARALRLEVLVATSKTEEAQDLAGEILTRDATSPHAVRAREVLKKSDPKGSPRR